jgi:hypothetical protein
MRLMQVPAGISDSMRKAVESRKDAIKFQLQEADRESWQTVRPSDVGAPADFKGVIQRDGKTGALRVQKFGPDAIMSGEKSYDQTIGKGYGETMLEIQKMGRSANSAMSSLGLMERAINNPGFYSGSASEVVNAAKKAAVSLGVADADNAAPNELFAKVANKLVLDLAGGSLGTGFSNADRDYLASTVPNLANTPEGNKQIIQVMKTVEQRKSDVAKLAREYSKQNGRLDAGFDEQLAQWSEANPLFKGAQQASPAPAKQGASPLLDKARDAIAKGAPRDAVMKRLMDSGIDPAGL